MLKHSLKTLSAGTVLVLAASGVWAQTTTPSTTIGVTPQDAREATQKAVPRADTGTLVRTEPSAADRASDMARDAKEATSSMARDAKDAVTPDARSTTTAPMGTTNRNTNRNTTTASNNNKNRPARADRN